MVCVWLTVFYNEGKFLQNKLTSELYLGFYFRDFSESPHLALTPHTLQATYLWFGLINNEGKVTFRTS
jgi:hypothetical protein